MSLGFRGGGGRRHNAERQPLTTREDESVAAKTNELFNKFSFMSSMSQDELEAVDM